MPKVELTISCIITDAQYEAMRVKQDEGEFYTSEALALIEEASDATLTQIGPA